MLDLWLRLLLLVWDGMVMVNVDLVVMDVVASRKRRVRR